MPRRMKWAATALVVVAIGIALAIYWRKAARHPFTDDAYVGVNVVRMAPQVTGTVTVVYARDFQLAGWGVASRRTRDAGIRPKFHLYTRSS